MSGLPGPFETIVLAEAESPAEDGTAHAIAVLEASGFETFTPGDGSPGHACSEPRVCFHGSRDDANRALAAALEGGLRVHALRRIWDIVDGKPTEPHWELMLSDEHGTDVK